MLRQKCQTHSALCARALFTSWVVLPYFWSFSCHQFIKCYQDLFTVWFSGWTISCIWKQWQKITKSMDEEVQTWWIMGLPICLVFRSYWKNPKSTHIITFSKRMMFWGCSLMFPWAQGWNVSASSLSTLFHVQNLLFYFLTVSLSISVNLAIVWVLRLYQYFNWFFLVLPQLHNFQLYIFKTDKNPEYVMDTHDHKFSSSYGMFL